MNWGSLDKNPSAKIHIYGSSGTHFSCSSIHFLVHALWLEAKNVIKRGRITAVCIYTWQGYFLLEEAEISLNSVSLAFQPLNPKSETSLSAATTFYKLYNLRLSKKYLYRVDFTGALMSSGTFRNALCPWGRTENLQELLALTSNDED